ASIAVSEQNRALDSELVQQLRQYAQCLSVHVGHSSWSCKTCGLPITVPGVGEYPRAGPLGEPSREVTPHGERAQALVQHDQRWRIGGCDLDELVFQLPRANCYARHQVLSDAARAANGS